MAFLSAQDVQALADMVTEVALTDTCDIQRKSQTLTAMREATKNWPVVATVPCALIDAGTPQEQAVAVQQVGSISQIMLLPRLTDVRGNDRLVKGGLTYHIIDLYEPKSFEVVRRVLVRRSSLPSASNT
jgi:hypothetical protein